MELRKLHRDFGVEVLDFDIQVGADPEDIAALRRAWDDHGLLLFRGQGALTPERQLEIARWFGPPPPVDNTGHGDFVTMLHNRDDAGRLYLPFHSDQTYSDQPIDAICLHAIALPDGPTSTTFVSGVAAWRGLPDALRAEAAGLTLRHKLEMAMSGFDWPVFVADHPLVMRHPRHGAEILFATEHHAERILELDEAESRDLIERLFAHLYAAEARYEHVWQLHDLLLIDNLALQHARMANADPAKGERALQRVTLARETLGDLIERARRREAEGASA